VKEAVTYQVLLQEVRDQGYHQGLSTVALNLLREGIEIAQVAKLTGLPTEQVQRLSETGTDQSAHVDPLANFIGAVSHGSLAQQPDVELYGD
jgi:predicted transposase YdaD